MNQSAIVSPLSDPIQSPLDRGTFSSVLEAFQNPLVWFDFTDNDSLTLTSTALDLAANKGTGGDDYDLEHNGGVQITITGGEAVCNGSQNNYGSGAAGDYDFLHDGTGSHVFYIIEHDSSDTGENFLHITNVSGSANNAGSRLTSQQTSDNNQYRSITGYGAGNLTHASDVATLPEDIYTIAEHSIATVAGSGDIIIRDDGVGLVSATDGGLLSASSHADIARFLVSGVCKVKAIFVFNKRLSDFERKAFYRKAASHYSLPAINMTMLIGDSNAGMQNAASGLSADYDAIIPNAYIWAYEDGNTGNDLAFWPMEAAHGAYDATSSAAGPELALAYNMAETTGEKEYVVKSYENGSDLYAKWNITDFPEYSTAWDDLLVKVAAVKQWATDHGRTINWRFCLQILGHNDCSATYRANNYEDNLSNLIALIDGITSDQIKHVVTITSLEGLDNPDAGFSTAAYQSTVRAAIQAVANDDNDRVLAYQPLNSAITDIGWNETTPDGIHYDIATMEDMGEDIAAMVASSVPVVSTAPTIDSSAGTGIGSILRLDFGIWTNGVVEARDIQWKRDGVAISGATGWEYTTVSADDGTDITVTLTPVNGAGEGTEATTAAVAIAAAITPLGSVVASNVFDLDVTISDSYDGTDTSWLNLEPTPADGSAQSAYDFTLGSTSSADTADPLFVGTAGDQAARWEFDGGDYFRNASPTQFFKDLHKHTSGQDFTLVWAMKTPPSGTANLFWGGGHNASNPGILIKWDGLKRIDLNQRGDTGTVTPKQSSDYADYSEDVVMGVAYDHAAEEMYVWSGSATRAVTSIAFNASTVDAPQAYFDLMSVAGGGTPSGTLLYAISGYNEALSDSSFADIVAEYEDRHGRTY